MAPTGGGAGGLVSCAVISKVL
eukprot:COSAG06_NODE_2141_length_7492_cov_2.079399_1_plen_21_part_10